MNTSSSVGLAKSDGIDLPWERRHQSRDESRAFRMLDAHFVVQDAHFHA